MLTSRGPRCRGAAGIPARLRWWSRLKPLLQQPQRARPKPLPV